MKIPGFISYSHKDGMELTDGLAAYLNNLFPNFEPVYDKDIPEGEKLDKIKEKLSLCNILIVIITPDTLDSIPVTEEITFAIEKGMKIIPCKDNYLNKNWEDLPWDLKKYKGIEFENAGELKRKTYNALMKLLKELLKELEHSLPKKIIAEKPEPSKVIQESAKESAKELPSELFLFETKKGHYFISGGLLKGKITGFSLDRKALSLIADIETPDDDTLHVLLKTDLINSLDSDGKNTSFIVLVDGEEVEHKEVLVYVDSRGVEVQVKKDSKQVEIIGTQIEGISYLGEAKKENEVKILQGSAVPHDGQHLNPETLTIKIGDTVKWINDDSAAHTVTNGTPGEGPDGYFDSSMLMSKATFSVTFNEAGTYPYFDMVHPWIVGTIIVEE